MDIGIEATYMGQYMSITRRDCDNKGEMGLTGHMVLFGAVMPSCNFSTLLPINGTVFYEIISLLLTLPPNNIHLLPK